MRVAGSSMPAAHTLELNQTYFLSAVYLLELSDQTASNSCCCFPFVLAQFAGEDPVVALEAALQFEDTQESMHAFCVGQYLEVSLRACFNMQGCEGTLSLYVPVVQ